MNEDLFWEDVKGALTQIYPHAYFSSWTSAEYHSLTSSGSNDYILFSDKFEKDEIVFHYNQKVYLKKIESINTNHILSVSSLNGGYKIADIQLTIIDCFLDTTLAGGDEIIEDIVENAQYIPQANIKCLAQCAKESNQPNIISELMKYINF